MGEEEGVLRVGGLAGVLAGVIVVVALITFVLQLPPPGPEGPLTHFPQVRTLTTATIHLFSLALLLGLAFLAALYRSLREPSRVFARIGLGSGVLAIVITIVALQGTLMAVDTFSGLYADPTQERPVVVAAYWAVLSILSGGNIAGFLFTGLAFAAFGLAMRGSQNYPEGLAWLSIVLGIVIVLSAFLALPWGIVAIAVLFLVLGWKVYSLSSAA